ncbi:hypothetical protein ACFWO4_22900, partial [Streptomyces diastaticus]
SQTSATIYTHGWYGQGTYYADDLSLDGPGVSGPARTAGIPDLSASDPSPTHDPVDPHEVREGSCHAPLPDSSPRVPSHMTETPLSMLTT